MASEDVQTNLRLPADLKERLVASAAENNRSLSAEVASRLEQSFREPRAALEQQVDLLVQELKGKAESIGWRAQLLESRGEALQAQLRMISFESDHYLKSIDTDEGLRKAEMSAQEFRELQEKISRLTAEGEALVRERQDLLELSSKIAGAFKGKREELERALREGYARRRANS